METNFWFLFHDDAPAHRSVLVKDFLAKNNVTTQEQPPHSPDLAQADVYPFPRLKSALKLRRFFDANDIIKNATEELKRFSLNGFQEGFQHLHSFWQTFIATKWNYFEGNVV
jgi:transposase